jgi:hypothetical protein
VVTSAQDIFLEREDVLLDTVEEWPDSLEREKNI